MSTDVKQPVIDALEQAFAKTGTEPSLKAYEALNNIDMKNIERVEESIKDIGTDKFKIEKQLDFFRVVSFVRRSFSLC